jgi:excinuclease ABC subunit A
MSARLADSFETALALSDGIAVIEFADGQNERIIFSGEVRLPGVRLHHRGDRAAALLVQQPVRRLPGLRRPRHRAVLRGLTSWCRTRLLSLNRGAIAPWARTSATSPYYQQTLESLPAPIASP